jgi:TolB-like protein/tetratricopeptide (TPR) repeat protein
VLPFVDMSEGQDHGYLADGIAEEILNRLAQSKDLRVISRTSSFAFRGKPLDVGEIAAKLDVGHVLEGSVRRSGDRIRITAQLIAASDDAHVWSETYDRESGDTFSVQDEIAAAVATALHVTLRGSGACCPAPASAEALELFLQGQFFYNRRSPGDIDRAVENFRKAVAIDPQYATAWAALAGAYSLLIYDHGGSVEELRPLQRDAAQKAVELAPGLAVAQARLGQYYFNIGDRVKGHEQFEKAAALDPNDLYVMGHMADRAFWRGDLDEAVAIWRRIVARNPLSATDRFNLANFLYFASLLEESAAEFRKALELNPDFRGTARLEFVTVLVTLRRFDEAHAQVLKLPEGAPRDQGLALLHEAPGHEAEADAALARLAARPAEPGDTRLGELYAFRGMKEEAIAALIDARDAMGSARDPPEQVQRRLADMRNDLLRSPQLKVLHEDPRWAELTADPR